MFMTPGKTQKNPLSKYDATRLYAVLILSLDILCVNRRWLPIRDSGGYRFEDDPFARFSISAPWPDP